MIAFLGTGLIGSGFVRALLRRGEAVNVWNRTADKARALEAHGARAFDDPAAATRGAERVHVVLSDDAAVDDVLARAALERGTDVVDHTTTSPSGTAARVARWNARGIAFVHAPIFMAPQNALESTGIMLVCGERARVGRVRPHLEPMTGKLVDLGERPDVAAAFKLLGNSFLMFLTAGLAEFFGLGRAMDVPPHAAAELFAQFNPGVTIPARIDRMLRGAWSEPSWELAMARKDARLMLEAASGGGKSLPVLAAIAARMDALIAEGHGHDDWTVLAMDALR
jgi:3-hydroxyisobutyrate dehydrogenase